jgi:hypothetical protein
VRPGKTASAGSAAMGIETSTPLMRGSRRKILPPARSTAVPGLKCPAEVIITVSRGLAGIAGEAIDVLTNVAATTALAAAIRPLFHATGRASKPTVAPDVRICPIFLPSGRIVSPAVCAEGANYRGNFLMSRPPLAE